MALTVKIIERCDYCREEVLAWKSLRYGLTFCWPCVDEHRRYRGGATLAAVGYALVLATFGLAAVAIVSWVVRHG